MGHLKMMQEALILLVVDLTDIRGSIHKQLPEIIGDKKPMIVIGKFEDLVGSISNKFQATKLIYCRRTQNQDI
jgi:ribosome biogenesis GTPase A